MKVENMTSPNGNKVPNQFVIESECDGVYEKTFQSYNTTIAAIIEGWTEGLAWEVTKVDRKAWNCSKTTAKYRNIFLGETTKETQAKIDSGEYILADLNK